MTGAGTLTGFGNADPRAVGSYDDPVWNTYNGYAMAVIRSGEEEGKIRAEFKAEGCRVASVEIEVKKP